MWQMFYDCKKITTLDVSSFNTENVTTMSSMFYNCLDLTTIYAAVGANWNKAGLTSTDMFSGCSNLVGGKGTPCDGTNDITAARAKVDGGSGNEGYFTEPYAVVGGHAWVDLGLTDGTLWATTNVGATNPEDKGDYFAWGETEPYYSSLDPLTLKTGKENGYDWESYKYGNDAHSLTKYNFWSEGGPVVDRLGTLDPIDDAAVQNWGEGWRMPTESEFDKLYSECYWEWTIDYKGDGTNVEGFIVYKSVDKNLDREKTKESDHTYSTTTDAHIFLPLTGDIDGDIYSLEGTTGEYWTSTVSSGNVQLGQAHCLYFTSSYTPSTGNYSRDGGRPVRAVYVGEENSTTSWLGTEGAHQWVDLGLPSGAKWATMNVGAVSDTAVGSLFSFDLNGYTDTWEGNWQVATTEQWQELIDNCFWMFYSANINGKYINGYNVYKVKDNADKGKFFFDVLSGSQEPKGEYKSTDAHIFVPTTSRSSNEDEEGYYWPGDSQSINGNADVIYINDNSTSANSSKQSSDNYPIRLVLTQP